MDNYKYAIFALLLVIAALFAFAMVANSEKVKFRKRAFSLYRSMYKPLVAESVNSFFEIMLHYSGNSSELNKSFLNSIRRQSISSKSWKYSTESLVRGLDEISAIDAKMKRTLLDMRQSIMRIDSWSCPDCFFFKGFTRDMHLLSIEIESLKENKVEMESFLHAAKKSQLAETA